jgi:hypothetical protein
MSDRLMADWVETRPTCGGCHWHGTLPEVWYGVSLVGHYCYRDSGAPSRREVTASDADCPLGCCRRWEEAANGRL